MKLSLPSRALPPSTPLPSHPPPSHPSHPSSRIYLSYLFRPPTRLQAFALRPPLKLPGAITPRLCFGSVRCFVNTCHQTPLRSSAPELGCSCSSCSSSPPPPPHWRLSHAHHTGSMRAARRATAVRFATLLYLIEFLKTCHLLFTTPGSSGRVVPVVPAHPIFALGEQSTRAVFAALLASLAAFGLGVTRASSAVTCAMLVLLQLADVTRCVCWLQTITGLFCAFALEDLSDTRFSLDSFYPPGFVVAAQWTWAGLHKLNPSFLFGDMQLIDPVVLMLTGRSELLVPSRLCGAILETLAGSWLLYVFAVRMQSPLHRWVCVPCIFLSAMHVFLLIRLIQLDWARAAWGWNVWFSILALLFWDEVAGGTQYSHKVTAGRSRPCSHSSMVSSAKIGFSLVYAVLPALTMFGLMPMFLGHAIYNANVVRTNRLT
jgi:hypothetical protein